MSLRYDTNFDFIKDRFHFDQVVNQEAPEGQLFYSEKTPDAQEEIIAKVKDYLKDRLLDNFVRADDKRAVVERHWQTILDQACANIGEDSSNQALFLAVKKVHDLAQELDQIVVAVEPQGIFPWLGEKEPKENESIRNLLKYLLHDIALNRDIANCETLALLTFCASEESMGNMRAELGALLALLFAKTLQPEGKDNFVLEMMIGHVIALAAHLGCYKDGDKIAIPVKIESKWELITHTTSLIVLTPDAGSGYVDAVVWIPDRGTNAPPILAFKPTQQSFFSMWNNWLPNRDVGSAIGVEDIEYANPESFDRYGPPPLSEFFKYLPDSRFEGQRVQVYGIGQGASLAYQIQRRFRKHTTWHAYGPVGLASQESFTRGLWQGDTFMDPNYLISLHGQLPDGPNHRLIKVIRASAPSFPLSDIRLYGGEETLLLRVNIVWENQRAARQVVTFLHDLFSIPLTIILGTCALISNFISKIFEIALRCIREPCFPDDPCVHRSIPLSPNLLASLK